MELSLLSTRLDAPLGFHDAARTPPPISAKARTASPALRGALFRGRFGDGRYISCAAELLPFRSPKTKRGARIGPPFPFVFDAVAMSRTVAGGTRRKSGVIIRTAVQCPVESYLLPSA